MDARVTGVPTYIPKTDSPESASRRRLLELSSTREGGVAAQAHMKALLETMCEALLPSCYSLLGRPHRPMDGQFMMGACTGTIEILP